MQTKLTLRLDEELIRRAKEHARRSGKSVSRIVSDFLALLEDPVEMQVVELTPTVRSLVGALSGNPVGENDYHRYLEEKHR
jgi:hypothetical protein